jgi:hypothetical protein
MLLGLAVLIVLRIYLQIYVEHGVRLDRLARSVSAVWAPTLVPLENSAAPHVVLPGKMRPSRSINDEICWRLPWRSFFTARRARERSRMAAAGQRDWFVEMT